MSAMIEKVARAIDPYAWKNEAKMPRRCDASLAAARAAVGALEEATNLMVEAAVLADPYSCDVDDHNLVYPKIWYAMVHAALTEERT